MLAICLIEKSLILREQKRDGSARWRMLEAVQELALDKIRLRGALEETRGLHAEACLHLARAGEVGLFGREQQSWLHRLEDEHSNFQAALAASEGAAGRATGFELAVCLSSYWLLRGRLAEGRAWLARFLRDAHCGAHSSLSVRAFLAAGSLAFLQGDLRAARSSFERALHGAQALGINSAIGAAFSNMALCARDAGDTSAAEAYCHEALSIFGQLGDRRGRAGSLNTLGNLLYDRSRLAEGEACYREALEINRALGNRAWEALNLINVGRVAQARGRHESAVSLYDEAVHLERELGNAVGEAHALNNLGHAASVLGDLELAKARFQESLALFCSVRDQRGAAIVFDNLGSVAHSQGNLSKAQSLYEESSTIRRQLGQPPSATLLVNLGRLARDRGQIEAFSLLRQALQTLRSSGERLGWLGALEAAVELLVAAGHHDSACRLAGAVDAARNAWGVPQPPTTSSTLSRCLAAARDALGTNLYEATLGEGRRMPIETSMEEAERFLQFRQAER